MENILRALYYGKPKLPKLGTVIFEKSVENSGKNKQDVILYKVVN